MKKIIFFFGIAINLLYGQNLETFEFRQALSASSDSARLALLDSFLVKYPKSELRDNVFGARYSIYLSMGNDSAAFASLHTFFSTASEQNSIAPLNSIAMDLALRNIFLDSASAYIDTAIARNFRLTGTEEPVLLNSRAFVFYVQKKYAQAESVQTSLLTLLPEDAHYTPQYEPYFALLGMIQFDNNKQQAGLTTIVTAQLFGSGNSFPEKYVDSLFVVAFGDSIKASAQKEKMYLSIVHNFVHSQRDTVFAKSRIASTLARQHILLSLAEQYATEAYTLAQSRTLEERSGAAATLGIVLSTLGKYEKAIVYLKEAASYASPNETEIFKQYGDALVNVGKKKEAFDAYMRGVTSTKPNEMYQKLSLLHRELYPSLPLDSMIMAAQAKVLTFAPEKYVRPKMKKKKSQHEKIVLAELFTGSECPPCQAADIAFDYLLERYDASALTILEYHQNIPLPDPLANQSTENRAEFYTVNSTPTAIFGGKTVIRSGGNKLMAKNKFLLYNDIIEKELLKPTTVDLNVRAGRNSDVISLLINVAAEKYNKNLRVQVALVEDEVMYEGSNGVRDHKFVVRYLVKQGEGFSFYKSKTVKIQHAIDLKVVEAELKKYSDDIVARSSSTRATLHERHDTIDRKRLALAVFVQDIVTREVFQSKLIKVE